MDLLQELDRSPKVTQSSWPGGGATAAESRAAKKAAARGWEEAWERIRDTIARPALTHWRAHRYPTAIAALTAALAVYDRLRADRGGLSFQDLLCKAAGLLARHPEVRRVFRHRYTHILVDEFQDTDPVQAEMLLLLTAGDPRETDWRKCVPVPDRCSSSATPSSRSTDSAAPTSSPTPPSAGSSPPPETSSP
jgi:ATP-dependent helicase/nuclease subunit A